MSAREKSPAAIFLENNPQYHFKSNGHNLGLRGLHANNADDSNLYQLLRNKLKKVDVDGEELYIAEGDTLLDEAQLEIYAMQKQAVIKACDFEDISDAAGLGKKRLSNDNDRGLVGITQGGKLIRWESGTKLTYCVLKRTFASGTANYDIVRENFMKATEEWEATCGIEFDYKPALDNSTNTDPSDLGVVFVVREFDAGGEFIASAFFPNDPAYRRRVLIDPSYYEPGSFNKVGVLRHELGHVLGFRHEHIRPAAPDPCYNEDLTDVIDLTTYDSKSVMHYLCGGAGDPQLKITSLDKDGAQKLYGLPFNMVKSIA